MTATSLTIEENDVLTDLNGLSNLTSVTGNFTIVDNNTLPNLDGLSSLTTIIGIVRIFNNDVLCECAIPPVCSSSGQIINNNLASGACADLPTALNACTAGPDADGDGFTICEGDCDDTDGTVFPNAPEICDGADNNCDGNIDEGFSFDDYYVDADGDGFGDENAIPVSSCAPIPLIYN